MISDLELYGKEMPTIPKEVTNPRIDQLKERLEELVSVHYMEQDNHLINITQKAIVFWRKLRDGEENENYS